MSIPFESVVVALLTGIFGYAIAWFNNRSRIKAEERQRKEGQYYGFIGELIKCKSNDRNPMWRDTVAMMRKWRLFRPGGLGSLPDAFRKGRYANYFDTTTRPPCKRHA